MLGERAEDYLVLSVDDEPVVHRMLGAIIGEGGLPVRLAGTASSGAEALRLAGELRPDICILDIHMDGMSGLELAERLAAALDYRPRLIYLTAYDRFDYARQAIHLGAMEYILKPIRREELLAALGRAVNQLQAERLSRLESERARRLGGVLPSSEAPSSSRNACLARAVRAYIEEHYAEEVSLESAAELLGLSAGYVGSIFKAEQGLSFRACLRSVRVARACELIADQRLNLSEVAQRVGYEDCNYFSQAFLRETGVRPSEYRGGGRRWAK